MTGTATDAIALRLTDLRHRLPQLIEQNPGDAFWCAYAEIADSILEDAAKISDDDYDNAFLYQNAILFQAGMISEGDIQT